MVRRRILTFLKKKTVLRIVFCCLFISGLIGLELLWTPHISNIRYWTEGKRSTAFASFPITLWPSKKPQHVRFSLTIRPWDVQTFIGSAQLCGATVLINGVRTPELCSEGKYLEQDYAPYLRVGVNDFEIIANRELKQSVNMIFSPWSGSFPYRVVWWYTILGAIFCIVAIFHDTVARKQWHLTAILAGGTLLRLSLIHI